MRSIRRHSPAKINLGLWVGRRRPDGFHEIITTMVPLVFGDRVTIKKADKGIGLKIKGLRLNIPVRDNLAYRAAELFFQFTGINAGCEIVIHKQIPPGSGLGGGSSNAAAVITGLARLYQQPLNQSGLRTLALKLGSDVPFFLKGGAAVA
ncbi:MAG: 4-(cytidine 5'-diphospho)-2-C-methyl-D-erythritol kinase, partial [bacterium]